MKVKRVRVRPRCEYHECDLEVLDTECHSAVVDGLLEFDLSNAACIGMTELEKLIARFDTLDAIGDQEYDRCFSSWYLEVEAIVL